MCCPLHGTVPLKQFGWVDESDVAIVATGSLGRPHDESVERLPVGVLRQRAEHGLADATLPVGSVDVEERDIAKWFRIEIARPRRTRDPNEPQSADNLATFVGDERSDVAAVDGVPVGERLAEQLECRRPAFLFSVHVKAQSSKCLDIVVRGNAHGCHGCIVPRRGRTCANRWGSDHSVSRMPRRQLASERGEVEDGWYFVHVGVAGGAGPGDVAVGV